MRKPRNRWIVVGVSALIVVALAPCLGWLALRHEPDFYRRAIAIPHAEIEVDAKHFVQQSVQLSNDIINEPKWEAAFSDHEVNAWLAEDLVKSFADLMPPGMRDPRVIFDVDRITLAFQMDRGAFRSVVWVVVRVRVPEGNVIELTFEKMRAGALPLPADRVLDRLVKQGRERGLEMEWRDDPEGPIATLRYSPKPGQDKVVLDRLRVLEGRIVFAGHSTHPDAKGLSRLPNRRVLQSRFPRRNRQVQPGDPASESILRSSTRPAS